MSDVVILSSSCLELHQDAQGHYLNLVLIIAFMFLPNGEQNVGDVGFFGFG